MPLSKVYTVGVWDMLHVGHVRSLEASKALGDYLIVGVHTDVFVSSYKRDPVISYDQRVEMLRALSCVDEVIVGPPSNSLTKEWYAERGIGIHAVSTEYTNRTDTYVPARELGILVWTHSTLFVHTTAIINNLTNNITRVCIVGGGASAQLLAGLCGAAVDIKVSVLTRQPDRWNSVMTVVRADDSIYTSGKVDMVSNDPAVCVSSADFVIVCLPAFARAEVLAKIGPHLKQGAVVGSLPGTSGFDLMAQTHLPIKQKKIVLFGTQRLPFVCRVVEYGHTVKLLGSKSVAPVAVIPQSSTEHVRGRLSAIIGMPCPALSSFLEVTLTPSNPILHPSRMYGIFEGKEEHVFDHQILFYEQWDERSVRILKQCDEEVQALCHVLECPQVLPLVESYPAIYGHDPSKTLLEMIRTNPPYQGIHTPMKPHEGGWIADFESRYLTEDVPYGLVLLCVIAKICKVDCPMLHRLLEWSQKVIGQEYLVDGQLVGKGMHIWEPLLGLDVNALREGSIKV